MLRVLVASWLEPALVARIRTAVPGVDVVYEPELLPAPRYPADHDNTIRRPPKAETRWRAHLARADVLFDFDHTHLEDLAALAPRVKWIQATSAGIGQLLLRTGLDRSDIQFTTASGVHAVPLAEFCLLAMLAFAKRAPQVLRQQREHRWERYAGTELRGKTLALVGLGGVGQEVARLARAMGIRVLATRRDVTAGTHVDADAVRPVRELTDLLSAADYVVLAVPHTAETEGMIGERELRAMRRGAVLINIARGKVVDEQALLDALRSGHLGGAALDVFSEEPLSSDSPFWDLPNVFVSPHSASTVETENEKLTELFCENLRRYLAGDPLLNLFDRRRGY